MQQTIQAVDEKKVEEEGNEEAPSCYVLFLTKCLKYFKDYLSLHVMDVSGFILSLRSLIRKRYGRN